MTTSLIIGGTSGVGLATARRLITLGDDVHVAGRDPERVKIALAQLPGARGHQLDARDTSETQDLAASIAPIDRLILTFSGNEGAGALADLDLDALRRAFDGKFWPTIHVIQTCLPHLAPEASISLVSAITARVAMPGTVGLAALNAAVEGLVQPLAAELAPVRVNVVSPGYVDTPWWSTVPATERGAMFDQIAATLPTKQIAAADDVAAGLVLLATTPNITGTTLEIDSGSHLTA